MIFASLFSFRSRQMNDLLSVIKFRSVFIHISNMKPEPYGKVMHCWSEWFSLYPIWIGGCFKTTVEPLIWYKSRLSRQYNCWSLRCSRSIACRRCSNDIFILDLTPGINGLAENNCNRRQETFKFWDLVWLILDIWRYQSHGRMKPVKVFTPVNRIIIDSGNVYVARSAPCHYTWTNSAFLLIGGLGMTNPDEIPINSLQEMHFKMSTTKDSHYIQVLMW